MKDAFEKDICVGDFILYSGINGMSPYLRVGFVLKIEPRRLKVMGAHPCRQREDVSSLNSRPTFLYRVEHSVVVEKALLPPSLVKQFSTYLSSEL